MCFSPLLQPTNKGGEVFVSDHPLREGQAERSSAAEHPQAEDGGHRREEARRRVDEASGENLNNKDRQVNLDRSAVETKTQDVPHFSRVRESLSGNESLAGNVAGVLGAAEVVGRDVRLTSGDRFEKQLFPRPITCFLHAPLSRFGVALHWPGLRPYNVFVFSGPDDKLVCKTCSSINFLWKASNEVSISWSCVRLARSPPSALLPPGQLSNASVRRAKARIPELKRIHSMNETAVLRIMWQKPPHIAPSV